MPSLFDWLDHINTGKAIDVGPDETYKEYVPFQINNGMSQYLDTVLLANEMNKRPWLNKEMQLKFYISAVSKKRRYGKWAKAEEPSNKEDITTVAEYYSVNERRAAEYIKLLKPEHIDQMRRFLNKGGAEAKMGRGKK
jgi:hypothetical protein